MSYCQFCENRPINDVHRVYHDEYYGFPIEDDNELFGRLVLEINQAGLSWETILKKEENFRAAFDQFNIQKIAGYQESRVEQLLQDSGIIRNKLKIRAVIYNAKAVLEIQENCGTFKNWLDSEYPKSKDEWVKLFKTKFKFVGGEIVNEFLMSTGYLSGAHTKDCQTYERILKLNPKWIES